MKFYNSNLTIIHDFKVFRMEFSQALRRVFNPHETHSTSIPATVKVEYRTKRTSEFR